MWVLRLHQVKTTELDDPNYSRQQSKCTAVGDLTIEVKVGAGFLSEHAQLQNEWPAYITIQTFAALKSAFISALCCQTPLGT